MDNKNNHSSCGLIIVVILMILMCATCVGTCSSGSSSSKNRYGYSQEEWDEAERAVREANDRYYRNRH